MCGLLAGLAVDYHNERLYWADAKLSVIGSIRLNGTDPVVAIDSKKGKRKKNRIIACLCFCLNIYAYLCAYM